MKPFLLCLVLIGFSFVSTETFTEHDVEVVEALEPKVVVLEVGQVQQTLKMVEAYGEAATLALQPLIEQPADGFLILECVECEPKQEISGQPENESETSEEGVEEEEDIEHGRKEDLLRDKSETFLAHRMIDWFEQNPEKFYQRQCFSEHLKRGDSIDFVIDLAPSPSKDPIDKMLAESPFGIYLEETLRDPSRAYFGSIELFIEAVTLDMEPWLGHTVIYNQGRKFHLRGRGVDEAFPWDSSQDFKDDRRNLLTLWPTKTRMMSESCIRTIVKSNLGHNTKMALWNRVNGLPIVLSEERHSKPVYTIVITDGASGASIHELTDNLSRTTVIDVGNQRFLKTLSLTEQRQLGGHFFALSAPQQLPSLLDTCRFLACRFASHREN